MEQAAAAPKLPTTASAATAHSGTAAAAAGSPGARSNDERKTVDIYHMDGYESGWVDAHVKSYYEKYIFPNISSMQKAILVPGSFGSDVNHFPNGSYVCNKSCYDDMCARDADDFYAWASTDARVAGVLTWNYGGCAACNGSHWTPPHTCCMDEIGTKDMPKALAAWEAVGRKLIGAATAS